MEICGVIVVEDARLTAACAHTRRIDAFSEVANRPIAHHVLDIVRSAGAKRIVVVSSDTCAAEVRRSSRRATSLSRSPPRAMLST